MSAQVMVCCGVGGTGKTTTSAALAVGQALAGHRVAVLTIDPARRLADALGLDALSNEPRPVSLACEGSLHALMLDRKGTWDAVIRARATPATAEALLANPYYQAVSTRLSGSHEFMAVEKLYELVTGGDFDVIVLDTPPAQHVVDFFQAPQRVRAILDRSLLTRLFEPTGITGAATRGALSIVNRLAGEGVMRELRGFFDLFAELSLGFRQRAAEVDALLTSERTRYWLITHADAPERNDLLGFLEELRTRGMSFAGFVVNRVQPEPEGPFPEEAALLAANPGRDDWREIAEALLALPSRARALAHVHQASIDALVQAAGGAPAWILPDVAGGVRTLEGLTALAAHLPPAPAER